MRDVFGARHKSLEMVAEPGFAHRFTPHPRTHGEYLDPAEFAGEGVFAGHSLRANLYVQRLELDGAEKILDYKGAVAGSLHRHGEGRAILLGTYAGHNATAYIGEASRDFVRKLLSLAGVETGANAGVSVRERAAGGERALVIFNTTPETKNITLPPHCEIADSYGGKITGSAGVFHAECAALDAMAVIIQ